MILLGSLYIKNIAVVESAEIEFEKGFNIFFTWNFDVSF